MDASALEQFNKELWRNEEHFRVGDLDRSGPVKIGGLIRSKTLTRRTARGGEIPTYYTFIAEDGKRLLKEWLVERQLMLERAGLVDSDYFFFNWRRGGKTEVQVRSGACERKHYPEDADRAREKAGVRQSAGEREEVFADEVLLSWSRVEGLFQESMFTCWGE